MKVGTCNTHLHRESPESEEAEFGVVPGKTVAFSELKSHLMSLSWPKALTLDFTRGVWSPVMPLL